MLKALQVVPSYYPATVYGGPIFSIHHTSEALARIGVDVSVATTNANGDKKLNVETRRPVQLADNYRVHYYDDTIINRFSWDFTKGLWRDIRAADIVHLQDVFSAHAALTFVLTALARKPLLVSARGVLAPWGLEGKRPWAKKLWLAAFVRPFASRGSRLAWHATAGSEAAEIHDVLPRVRVVTIPNGFDFSSYAAVARPEKSDYLRRFIPSAMVELGRARVIVGLGRLHTKKAFDVAIRAFRRIADKAPDAVLLIAGGDDGDAERLRRLIGELGLGGRAALVGEMKGADKIAFLKGADVFLFPTHNENFGNVVVEALAAGVPVVASRGAPWAELEEHGSGLWVENDELTFARATLELLGRDRAALAAAAKTHAARFDLQAVAAEFGTVYAELVHGH